MISTERTHMQALTLRQIKTPLVLEDRAALAPEPREVVVQVRAAALNRRDYWITQGQYPGIRPPVVLGSDAAGVVTSCGRDVETDWLNSQVVINPGLNWGDSQNCQSREFHILGLPRDGTFATEVAVPAAQLHVKPPHLTDIQAAALPLAGVTAYRALFCQGQLQAGETVLITGIGGGVATFALQYAIAAGARVWVTSSSADKIQQAMNLGAEGGFDYSNADWPQQMSSRAGAPNLIIDSAGGGGYGALIELAAAGGRIVSYGATTGAPDRLDLFKVFWKQLRLQGTTLGSPADFKAMLEFVGEHQIQPIIERVFPLADGNEALNLMATSPQFGKYVLSNT